MDLSLSYLREIQKKQDGWSQCRVLSGELRDQQGLFPLNYLDAPSCIGNYNAMYDYVAQNEEEIDLKEGDKLELLTNDDPDWWLIRTAKGAFGFVPSSYIEPVCRLFSFY